ncbi:hypothetical protein [Novosphingobium capsulatum]|uniref:hypothetical protein n=1 Tax=Novosphingobium capsulatum TaxID=13688 RepID=UPI0012ECE2E0|nr:hypothetical protein [Novosphingobium capsulatum]WQD91924.1 hypothetical protein U0041_13060 [Novosphingobium capsulatum]
MTDTNTLLGLTQAVTGLFALVAASTGLIAWISWRISPLEINFTEHRQKSGYSIWSAKVRSFRNIVGKQELYVCSHDRNLKIHRATIIDGPGSWGIVGLSLLPNGALRVDIELLKSGGFFSFRMIADGNSVPEILKISEDSYWSVAIGRFFSSPIARALVTAKVRVLVICVGFVFLTLTALIRLLEIGVLK